MINVENTGTQIRIGGLIMNGKESSAILYERTSGSNGEIYYMYSIPELGIRLSQIVASSPENAVSQVLYTVRQRMESIVEDARRNIELLNDKIVMTQP